MYSFRQQYSNSPIFFYSSHCQVCKTYISKVDIPWNNLFTMINVDDKNIRNIVLNSKIKITKVPCILVQDDNGYLLKYEDVKEWIINNIIKTEKENNNESNNDDTLENKNNSTVIENIDEIDISNISDNISGSDGGNISNKNKDIIKGGGHEKMAISSLSSSNETPKVSGGKSNNYKNILQTAREMSEGRNP